MQLYGLNALEPAELCRSQSWSWSTALLRSNESIACEACRVLCTNTSARFNACPLSRVRLGSYLSCCCSLHHIQAALSREPQGPTWLPACAHGRCDGPSDGHQEEESRSLQASQGVHLLSTPDQVVEPVKLVSDGLLISGVTYEQRL